MLTHHISGSLDIKAPLHGGLPWWLSWSRIHLQCGRPGFDPWVGKIPWRREGLPTPVLWPGKCHRLNNAWGSQRVGHDWATLPSSLTHSLTWWGQRASFAEACAPWRRSPCTSCFVLCVVPAGRSVNACWLDEVQETNTVALSQFSEGLSKGLLVTWLTIMPCPCHQHDQRVELQAGGTLVITCLVRPFKRLLLGHLTWCQSEDGLTVVLSAPTVAMSPLECLWGLRNDPLCWRPSGPKVVMHPTVVAPNTLCAGLRAPVRERGAAPPSVVAPVLIVGAGLRQNLSPWPVLSSSLLSPAGIPTGLVSEPSERSVSLRFWFALPRLRGSGFPSWIQDWDWPGLTGNLWMCLDGPSGCHTECSKSERSKQIACINADMWNLERWCGWSYRQSRNRDPGAKNTHVGTRGSVVGGARASSGLKCK